ncbi:hypothetical protein [Rhodococcus opacus]|nr:hypothetical protein [Rhodococcus opacus]MDV6247301.1 hypothetical protein [Rhodococcus opacus]
MNSPSLPVLAGVEHRFVDVGGGVTIHVADAELVKVFESNGCYAAG